MVTRIATKKKAQEPQKCLSGNFCRCTGYRPIIGACSKSDVVDIEDLVDAVQNETKKTASKPSGPIVNGGTGFLPITNASQSEIYSTKSPTSSISNNPDLQTLTLIDNQLTIGGAVTIQTFINKFIDSENNYARQMSEHWTNIASENIRNVASIAGNVILAHKRNFVSDVKPLFDLFRGIWVFYTITFRTCEVCKTHNKQHMNTK